MLRVLAIAIFVVIPLFSSSVLAQRHSVVKSVKGTVVDEAGKPVEGARVSNQFSHQPARETKTDANGRFVLDVRFDGSSNLFVGSSVDGLQQGFVALPDNAAKWKDREARVVLKPAAEAEVVLGGRGNDDGTNKSFLTDDFGRFEFGVPPHQLCMVGARSGKLVSPAIDGLISKPGEAIEGLELKLQPGIRIHGTIATGILSVAGAHVMLRQIGKSLSDFPDVIFPAPENSAVPPGFTPKVQSYLISYCDTDKRGKYEFYAPAGEYSVMLPLNSYGHETFKLTMEKEYEASFRSYFPLESLIENLAK